MRVAKGDSVYFRGGQGLAAGKVVCHGKHGATVDCDGARHQVPWDDIIGHKERVHRSVNLVEQGEDGALVEDEDGGRHYIEGWGADDDDEDEPSEGDDMKKSSSGLPGGPVMMLLKAGAIANRPGLVQQQITDNRGRTAKRWVRSNKDMPKARERAKPEAPGKQKMPAKPEASARPEAKPSSQFHAGNVQVGGDVHYADHAGKQGTGKVKAVGKDGVTIDEAAGEYKVRHEHITGHTRTEGFKPFVSDEENAKLPKNADQKVNDLEGVYKISEEAMPAFSEMSQAVAKALGGEVYSIPDDESAGSRFKEWLEKSDSGFAVVIGPLKKRERIKEKAEEDQVEYGLDAPPFNSIKDVVRGTIAGHTLEDVAKAMDALKAQGVTFSRQIKDRFTKPTPVDYRDILMNVTMPNGAVCEMQVNCREMLKAKNEAHHHYEEWRSLKKSIKDRGGKETPEETRQLQDLEDKQKEIYGAAWKRITGAVEKSILMIIRGGVRGLFRGTI